MIAAETLPQYEPQGLSAIIVHVGDATLYAHKLATENDHAFPMLLDLDETIIDRYIQLGPEAVLFPLGYLSDRDGVIRHVYNTPEEPNAPPGPPTLKSDIEALLSE